MTTTSENTPKIQEQSEQKQRSHYYLVSGKVIYQSPQPANSKGTSNNPWGMFPSNSVARIDSLSTSSITVSMLARFQAVLQQYFHIKTQDPSLVISDVIVDNFCYLGYMTEEEFHDLPQEPEEQPA